MPIHHPTCRCLHIGFTVSMNNFTRWRHGYWMLRCHLYNLVIREERHPLLLLCALVSVRRTLGKYFDWLAPGPTTVVWGIMDGLSQEPIPQDFSHIRWLQGLLGPGSHQILYLSGKTKYYTASHLYS